jgi:ubiquinone/menaquinone biosynthesis C-methylase UbiE
MASHQPATDVPNHHAHHPGFAGATGLLCALGMAVGRGADADLAIRLVDLRPGDHVVDVGCGPGAAARRAARAGARVTGIDPAPVMLSVARRLTRGGAVTYLEGRAEALPLGDRSADALWAIATVHHWPDVEAGVAEALRVLDTGGRFLAVERRTRPGATGLASHGWTDERAEAFAALCRTGGFADVRSEPHRTGRRSLVAVLATKP